MSDYKSQFQTWERLWSNVQILCKAVAKPVYTAFQPCMNPTWGSIRSVWEGALKLFWFCPLWLNKFAWYFIIILYKKFLISLNVVLFNWLCHIKLNLLLKQRSLAFCVSFPNLFLNVCQAADLSAYNNCLCPELGTHPKNETCAPSSVPIWLVAHPKLINKATTYAPQKFRDLSTKKHKVCNSQLCLCS